MTTNQKTQQVADLENTAQLAEADFDWGKAADIYSQLIKRRSASIGLAKRLIILAACRVLSLPG